MTTKESGKAVSSAFQRTAKIIDNNHDKNNNKNDDHALSALNKKKEVDGPKGLEPTRYGDWEKGGRCIDF